MGDSRFRGNGECFNFASSLYFHFCPAPFLISHSRSFLPFPPLFPFPPPISIPTLFPFPPPFPIPAKAGISRLLRQRRKLQYEEVQSERCPPRPRQREIPAFAGMGGGGNGGVRAAIIFLRGMETLGEIV